MSLKEWNILLSHISDFSDWLPFIIWFFLPRIVRIKYRYLGAYLFFLGVLKVCTFLLIKSEGQVNTMPFYHLMALIEFILIFGYFAELIDLDRLKKIILFSIVISLNILNTVFIQEVLYFNSNSWAINSIVLLMLSLLYLRNLFSDVEYVEIPNSIDFIIVSAFLVYFSGSLFLYLLSYDVLSNNDEGFYHNAWILRSAADIIKGIIITKGLWLAKTI